MEENKSILENFDMFLEPVDDLASLNINISDEDQAIQLHTSLPSQFEPFVHTLKYGSSKEVELKEKGLLNKGKSLSGGFCMWNLEAYQIIC